MRNYKRKIETKPHRTVNQETLDTILRLVKDGKSIRSIGKEVGRNESTVRTLLKRNASCSGGITKMQPQTSGMKRTIPIEEERILAQMIRIRAKWGYGMSRDNIKDMVGEFVTQEKGKETPLGAHLQKYCHFTVVVCNYITVNFYSFARCILKTFAKFGIFIILC